MHSAVQRWKCGSSLTLLGLCPDALQPGDILIGINGDSVIVDVDTAMRLVGAAAVVVVLLLRVRVTHRVWRAWLWLWLWQLRFKPGYEYVTLHLVRSNMTVDDYSEAYVEPVP